MRIVGAIAALLMLVAAAPTRVAAQEQNCISPPELIALRAPLPHLGGRLARGEPLTVVALGSSSTAGFGASSPTRSYPSRLAIELQNRLPGVAVRVVNRGIGGEEAADMVRRIERDVVPLAPDLVVWQVGTNAVLRGHDLGRFEAALGEGLRRLAAAGTDVVLMDLQYAPRVLRHRDYARVEESLARSAREREVGFFRRFDLMRHWVETRQLDFHRMLLADGLHLNDLSYGCVARVLAEGIVRSAGAPGAPWQTSRVSPQD